ncbi:MAG: hypothetical protein P9X24_02420 [Candidatus Hatepunaea meridiana]|nr:hypothetical protein [Candidatus Hatepunaea meridiana]
MDFAWTQFGVIIAVLAFVTPVASKAIKDDDQQRFVRKIKELSGVCLADMIRGLNVLFIKGFDNIDAEKHIPRINRFLWHLVFVGMIYSFVFFPMKFTETSEDWIGQILGFAFLWAFSVAIGIELGNYIKVKLGEEKIEKIGWILLIIVVVILVAVVVVMLTVEIVVVVAVVLTGVIVLVSEVSHLL